MQLPQEIPDGAATFEITCDIVATEAGDAANNITGKVVSVKIPMINWEHNYIYHYRVQMNLQQILGLKPVELEDLRWNCGRRKRKRNCQKPPFAC